MRIIITALVAALASVLPACSTAPKTVEARTDLRNRADAALATAQANDSSIRSVLNNSVGYAVFPTVGKGGLGVGGAYGKGVLYEGPANGGKSFVGYCDLTQGTIGLQAGGQSYTELIVFNTQNALDNFKAGRFEFDAQATAVALKSGAGANAKFSNGVAVFTMAETGLMFEASVGGQKFKYLTSEQARIDSD